MIDLWWRIVRFGFRLLYNEMAFLYDPVAYVVSLGSWRCWQRASLAFLPTANTGPILELAHGTGNLQIDLLRRGYRVIGLDLSAYMGQIARRKIQKAGMQPTLVRGCAQNLPFSDECFSAVVSTFPTAFITQPETLTQVHRVLLPHGQLVVVYSGILNGRGLLTQILEFAYRVTGQRPQRDQRFSDRIDAQFADNGFDTQWCTSQCGRSTAMVLIATKKGMALA